MRIFRKLFFWLFIFFAIWVWSHQKRTDDQPAPSENIQTEPLDAPLLAPPARPFVDETTKIDQVYVQKSARQLQLRRSGEVLKTYPINLGFSPTGDKAEEGDGKTPVGEYTIDWRNPKSSFYRSLHISYPRPDQMARADAKGIKPGGQIMIHGQPNNLPFKGLQRINKDWTNGCIAVSNAEMDELWAVVKDGTPITIIE